ncbi:DUF1707 domain-containing protein [Nocardia sp. NBC_00508]|uniref:DUF1707 SHOCT-like domain-containing protein n=1 Tax=Nocardia sp. NBC_00508 TaxID=2975992 RepID=UPI002E80783E|nr:DUF1707 domain-containing protein [Nocardia sp. NBC_00508]WUD68113.1 DUF1707 domain-containing protein [Nocardia sp. NBC_00508]
MGESAGPPASIADRERALRELTQHLGAGRIGLTEFDELSAVVAAATSKAQLAELFAELPGSTPPAPEVTPTNPLPRLAVLAGAAAVFSVVLAVTTGNWLWLLVILAAPALFMLTARTT